MVRTKKAPQYRLTTGGKAPRRKCLATRKHRFRPGTVALREIRKLQKTVNLILPKSRMALLIKELTQPLFVEIIWRKDALLALQEGLEAYLIEVFQWANDLAINVGGRKTIQVCDIRMAVKMMTRAHPFR